MKCLETVCRPSGLWLSPGPQPTVEINKDQPNENKQRLFLKAGQDAVMVADSLVFWQGLQGRQRRGKLCRREMAGVSWVLMRGCWPGEAGRRLFRSRASYVIGAGLYMASFGWSQVGRRRLLVIKQVLFEASCYKGLASWTGCQRQWSNFLLSWLRDSRLLPGLVSVDNELVLWDDCYRLWMEILLLFIIWPLSVCIFGFS